MKRKVIIAVVVVAVVAAVVGIYYAQKASRQPTVIEGVYLHPAMLQVHRGQEVSLNIKVNLSGRGVSGGEINLSFNPSVLRVTDVELGDFLGSSPVTGLKQLDNEAGVVRLALARVGTTPVPSPAGVLATVHFTVLDSAASGIYDLELTKVGLADENFQDITGFTVQGATIKITP